MLGLFSEASLTDYAAVLVAAPVNVFYALSRGQVKSGAPIKPPALSLQEIRKITSNLLAGAQLRRLLLWSICSPGKSPRCLRWMLRASNPAMMGFSLCQQATMPSHLANGRRRPYSLMLT